MSSLKVTQLEGDSPVWGWERRRQGFPCGLIMWGLGHFPYRERIREMSFPDPAAEATG